MNKKRTYLGAGAKVIARLGNVGRPPIAEIVETEYHGTNCHTVCARWVKIIGGYFAGEVFRLLPNQVIAR